MRKNWILVWAVLFVALLPVSAQVLEPVKWQFSLEKVNETQVMVVAEASIDRGWHLYSTDLPAGGPIPTSLNFEEAAGLTPTGALETAPKAEPSFDEAFQMEVGYFSGKVRLSQLVTVAAGAPAAVGGFVEFMACDDHRCLPPQQIDFELKLPEMQLSSPKGEVEGTVESAVVAGAGAEASAEADGSTSVVAVEEIATGEQLAAPVSEEQLVPAEAEAEAESYWGIFWLAFLGGLAALLTPCVFPMIPLTVSFFLRNADNRARALRDGLFYGLTIIFAYVFLGLAISVIFGANALNAMATNPVFNVVFFALLIFFAASFFGAFELTMPAKWSNALDSKADQSGGLLGVILMGLTFVLVSFSCTGPIVGTLLVEAAIGGSMFSPAVGMLGFGVALAVPFALFAIFPTALKSLPKSGGWMNSVKVVLGFVVLAFSLKFLSVADSVGQWGLLNREVFLVLWIAIFLLLGLYLLGKIKFAHDSDLPYLSVPRLLLAIGVFAFVFYLIPGLWGAPLRAVGSVLPSITTQEFNMNQSGGAQATVAPVLGEHMKAGPYGLVKYTDYETGLEAAKAAGKPVFLDFTGLGCANCKTMEAQVWSDPQVRDLLAEEFVIVSLYVDDRERLPESEQYVSELTGRKVRTVGNKWTDFQITRYNTNSQPYYVLLNHEEEAMNTPRGFNTDVEDFVKWLKEVL